MHIVIPQVTPSSTKAAPLTASAVLAALAILTAGTAAVAQPADTKSAAASYPTHTIRIITPVPPGAAPDVMARLYADQLSKSLRQPVTVENRAGASGNIGAEFVAKAPADGYTILYGYNQIPTMNPHLFAKLGYDMQRDLAPVTQTLSTAYVLLGNKDLPAKNLAEVIAYARKNPEKLAYASYGPGTASHLIFEIIQDSAKIKLLHVPYRQGALTDVLGGQVAMLFEPFPSGVPYAKSDKVRALAVTTDKRVPELPDVPAMNEAVLGLNLVGWQGVWVPRATPPEIVAKLNAEFVRITRTPDMRARIAELASLPMGNTPDEMRAAIQKESAQWGSIIKARHIVLD
ncbi:Bug family tripartite tricarboxylate transporter substrate binding protein [Pigmentiphaga litoralis]|uniref:Tripartite-type tricarboxylate transporter receptor subunit TctC n=1 Tax=Pigmentiphaga litoralis TaxID=516702 RepID=A0A7Y9IWH3_9BURK|nr:tripartite tricarboxylate transporter substrate binding protein [Pigmentiphaga litoralis]NYE22112.1 tripartite-type tricarboxylate transporter receptor subunit TctC [Pigmentiphaga litoralis]NYE84273.1 tripartite-type tricarboxylate transporter receptor subunit TctC [Pigmentiphaga litoralis]